jgi:hypothetical protein
MEREPMKPDEETTIMLSTSLSDTALTSDDATS